jgi:hypothetical protein
VRIGSALFGSRKPMPEHTSSEKWKILRLGRYVHED